MGRVGEGDVPLIVVLGDRGPVSAPVSGHGALTEGWAADDPAGEFGGVLDEFGAEIGISVSDIAESSGGPPCMTAGQVASRTLVTEANGLGACFADLIARVPSGVQLVLFAPGYEVLETQVREVGDAVPVDLLVHAAPAHRVVR